MCSAGGNALTILHDGTIYPCRRLPLPLGNVMNDNLFEVFYESPSCGKFESRRTWEDGVAVRLLARVSRLSGDGTCCHRELARGGPAVLAVKRYPKLAPGLRFGGETANGLSS